MRGDGIEPDDTHLWTAPTETSKARAVGLMPPNLAVISLIGFMYPNVCATNTKSNAFFSQTL